MANYLERKPFSSAGLKDEDEAGYVDEALRIAMETGMTIYDAIYIVFSRAKSSTLLTADRGQAKAALEKGLNVRLVD